MNKLLCSLIIIAPFLAMAQKPIVTAKLRKSNTVALSEKDREILSGLISTFDIVQEGEQLKVNIKNINGDEKAQALDVKVEDYEEYSKYTFNNPHQDSHTLDLYLFEKIKPTLVDNQDDINSEANMSDLRFDLHVLVDSATKKTIKAKTMIYFNDEVVASGAVENNYHMLIASDLSKKFKNYKLLGMQVIGNYIGSDKRAFDLEATYIQSEKRVAQKFRVSIQNMEATQRAMLGDEEETDIKNNEGEDNETISTGN